MFDIKNLKINLENLILNSNNVIIFPHKEADFDAIASSLGVSLIAENLKKESHIVIGDPIYRLDHGVQTIIKSEKDNHSIINLDQYQEVKNKDSLNILCDVNKSDLTHVKDFDRDHLVIIDHHNKDEKTFKAILEHIDTSASSASEIVTTLLSCYKINIPKSIANILLTGILLDTNKLSKNVTCDTSRVMTTLFESGATIEEANTYFKEDFKSDRKVQELVNNTKFLNYTIALSIGEEDREYTKEELAKAADYLLRYGVDASYAIGRISDDIVSISARSKDSVNVGNVMEELDGGGSMYSAATKLKNTTVGDASEKLLKLVLPNNFGKKLIKNTT